MKHHVYSAEDLPENVVKTSIIEQPRVEGELTGNITIKGRNDIRADENMKIYYEDHWRYFKSFEKHPYTAQDPKPQ